MNDTIKNPLRTQESASGSAGNAMAKAESERAIAEVQVALVVARANPRDQVAAVDRILNAFTRPSLAEVALYQYSKGGTDISGPSIRSAEAIAQQWGNILFGFREVSRGVGLDGIGFSEVHASAWDLETNTIRPVSFQVRHWRDTRGGGYPIKGEREIYELIANQAQRRVRSCILSVIPGDVVETAVRQAEMTLSTNADTSPEAMQKMVEAFEAYGVTKKQIETRIQRRLDAIQPAQVVTLKKIYASLRDGMSSPNDWFTDDQSESEVDPNSEASQLNQAVSGKTKAKDKPKDKKKEKAPEQQAPASQEQPQDDSGTPTFAEVADEINKATSSTALEMCRDMAKEVSQPTHRAQLMELIEQKATEFTE